MSDNFLGSLEYVGPIEAHFYGRYVCDVSEYDGSLGVLGCCSDSRFDSVGRFVGSELGLSWRAVHFAVVECIGRLESFRGWNLSRSIRANCLLQLTREGVVIATDVHSDGVTIYPINGSKWRAITFYMRVDVFCGDLADANVFDKYVEYLVLQLSSVVCLPLIRR